MVDLGRCGVRSRFSFRHHPSLSHVETIPFVRPKGGEEGAKNGTEVVVPEVCLRPMVAIDFFFPPPPPWLGRGAEAGGSDDGTGVANGAVAVG